MERRMLWEKQIADEKNQKFTLRYFLLVHPVPKGENVYGVAIDKISGGQVLEREEVSVCLTDRKKWKFFYRNCVRETHFLWNWQNWGMTIFLRKNLFTKEETHFIQKQRARISMIFRKIRAFLFAGYSVFL